MFNPSGVSRGRQNLYQSPVVTPRSRRAFLPSTVVNALTWTDHAEVSL